MKYTLIICVITLCLCTANGAEKCNRKDSNFNDCLRTAIEDVLKKGTSPNKDLGLPVLDPLSIPSLVIGAGSGPVALVQNYKNVKVAGYSKMHCDSAKMDFDEKTFSLDCTSPQVVMSFDYDINGRILLLPVFGKGPGSTILDKPNFNATFSLEEYEKKGKKHYKVVAQKLIMTPQALVFRYENLFEGDKTLSDNIHSVLNENWKEAYTDVQTSYEDAFAQIFASLFNNVLGRASVSEIFGDE